MMDNARLSALIGHIYDCAPDPARWDDLLGELCRFTESEVGTLSVIKPKARELRFCGTHGPDAVIEPLVDTYARHMPFFDILPAMVVGQPYLMSDMTGMIGEAGREILEDTVMFREWNRPHGLTDSYCITLFRKSDHAACLNLVLSEERRPVTEEDRRLVGLLVPHIRRAAMIGTQLESTHQEGRAFQHVADRMTNSLLIVAEDLRILYANPPAEQMLADGDIVSSIRGRLIVGNATAAARIERDVRLSAALEDELEGASFSIPMGDSFSPSIAHVIPLARRDLDRRLTNAAAAAIVIAAPQLPLGSSIDAFSDLFALTGAEKRVAQLAMEGFGRAAIADLTGVKESTVKSHLESIFSKTGASGQTALTILMRTLSPAVR